MLRQYSVRYIIRQIVPKKFDTNTIFGCNLIFLYYLYLIFNVQLYKFVDKKLICWRLTREEFLENESLRTMFSNPPLHYASHREAVVKIIAQNNNI